MRHCQAFFIVRGAPVLLYRKDLVATERLPFMLYSATALPLVIAITNIGMRTGRMSQLPWSGQVCCRFCCSRP